MFEEIIKNEILYTISKFFLESLFDICDEKTEMSLLEIIMNRKANDFSSINVASIMEEIIILGNAIDFVFKDGTKIRIDAKRKKGANRLFMKD